LYQFFLAQLSRIKVVAQEMCISSLQNPVLAAECSRGHCGIDVFSLKTSKAAFFSFLPVILALFCVLLFPGFSTLVSIGFDYLVKTDQMVKKKN
jgi:hypothetical protein